MSTTNKNSFRVIRTAQQALKEDGQNLLNMANIVKNELIATNESLSQHPYIAEAKQVAQRMIQLSSSDNDIYNNYSQVTGLFNLYKQLIPLLQIKLLEYESSL